MKGLFLLFTVLLVTVPIDAEVSDLTADRCHVYVVDTELAVKAQKELLAAQEPEMPKIQAKYKDVETLFPFEAEVAEEKQTTKHFAFPNSKLFITASVYYTDEMMASATGNDSMTLGIYVSQTQPDSAIGPENIGNAVADVAYNALTSKVHVKQYVTVNRKTYLVGLECETRLTSDDVKKLLRDKP